MLAAARVLLGSVALLACCACNSALVHGLASLADPAPSATPWSYQPGTGTESERSASLLLRFAPTFVVEEGEAEWNRIGTPVLVRCAGTQRARVDPARASLFAEAWNERVGERMLYQLVYRIHFDQLAPSWGALASLHRNAGLLVIVSVDARTELPLTVTTVHTCGCWLAVLPTMALAAEALPAHRPSGFLEIGGEELPARLPVPSEGQRYLVSLRSRTHRVHDVGLAPWAAEAVGRETVDATGGVGVHALLLRAMDDLRRLPIRGAAGETAPFFYEGGGLRGTVKGSWAPLEALTLGLLTLDLRLGMDRDFGPAARGGAPFYTALAPWKREDSRLEHFETALGLLGFRTEYFGPDEGG